MADLQSTTEQRYQELPPRNRRRIGAIERTFGLSALASLGSDWNASQPVFMGRRLSADSKWMVVFENHTGRGLKNVSIKLKIGDVVIPEKPDTINLVGSDDRVLIELSVEPSTAKVIEKWHGDLPGWSGPPTGTVLFNFEWVK